jgi:SAM-dependent methyltransferase
MPEILPSRGAGIAFDALAGEYVEGWDVLPATLRLRARLHRRMLARWRPGMRILEVNCGTGADAVALARFGMHVVPTDASSRMAAEANARFAREGLDLAAQVAAYRDLPRVVTGPFDGALSNFGGLNCELDLAAALEPIASLLHSGAMFCAGVLGKFSLWEMATGLARFRPSAAFRRISLEPVTARIGASVIPVRYWSIREIREIASPWFKIMRADGISVVAPPPGRVFSSSVLDAVDEVAGQLWPFSRLGDHEWIEFRRR